LRDHARSGRFFFSHDNNDGGDKNMEISVEVVSVSFKGRETKLKVEIAVQKKDAMHLTEWLEMELPLILNKQSKLEVR